MKLIINAEPDEMTYVLGLVMDARETFARHPSRIGWGWSFGKPGHRSFFIREIKGGFSASPSRDHVSLRSTPTTDRATAEKALEWGREG